MTPKRRKKTKNRRMLLLLCMLLAGALCILVPVLRKPSGPVNNENVPISYETLYSEYMREVLLPRDGKAEVGEYEYNRYGDTGEIQKARDKSGIISAKIEDFDGNAAPEMLVVSLVPGEENFDYSQIEIDLYGYDKKSGKVCLLRRLTEAFSCKEGDNPIKVRPITVTGMEDEVNLFFQGEYFCIECTAVGESRNKTVTLFEKEKLLKDPGVMICAEQKPGNPLTYYLYRPDSEVESLAEKDGKEEEYLLEFAAGNETPVSDEALYWLTSSIDGAKERFEKMGFIPSWQENAAFVWVDGRTGVFSVFDENAQLITSYTNHMEEAEDGPKAPAVQTLTDGTAFQKTYDF